MSPERDAREERESRREEPDREGAEEQEEYDEAERRSIFSAMWFRAVLVLIVIGVVAAVAVPYVLEWMNPPPPLKPIAAVKPPAAPAQPSAVAAPPTAAKSSERKEPASLAAAPAAGAPPAEPQKAEEAAGGRSTVTESARPKTPPAKKTTKKDAEPRRPAKTPASQASGGGAANYWVQVGAFKDPETAKRVAARLREQQYSVEESVKQGSGGASGAAAGGGPAEPTSAAPDRYDVLVSGGSLADINARLAAKGLAAEPSTTGVVIKPSLPLRDAVALSKDLATEGLKVQVKRATADGAPIRGTASSGGATLYRVRVGAYADRAAALGALRELEAKGYKPFLARGRE